MQGLARHVHCINISVRDTPVSTNLALGIYYSKPNV